MSKPWSYSRLKDFETCPKKYEASYVTKTVKYTDTEHTLYGKEAHSAAENFIKNGTPIPEKFAFIRPYVETLANIPGDKYCELKLGVKKDNGRLVACDFFDPDVWFRGVADLAIIDGDKGRVLDYKFGKSARYADTRQLALMAAALFLKFPELKTLKAALLFAVAKEFIKTDFSADIGLSIFSELDGLLRHREIAYNTGVFNPIPNGLCARWCEVFDCPHNGRS